MNKIKNICASCGKQFKNSKKHYLMFGNYCSNCISRINLIEEYRRKSKNPQKYSERLKEIKKILWERWKINAEELLTDNFIQYIKSIFKIKD